MRWIECKVRLSCLKNESKCGLMNLILFVLSNWEYCNYFFIIYFLMELMFIVGYMNEEMYVIDDDDYLG